MQPSINATEDTPSVAESSDSLSWLFFVMCFVYLLYLFLSGWSRAQEIAAERKQEEERNNNQQLQIIV